MYYENRMTVELRKFDRLLKVKRQMDGKYIVYRRSQKWEGYNVLGTPIYFLQDYDLYILALTDTWGLNGVPVTWSIDSVKSRLHQIDGHSDNNNSEKVIKDLEAENERQEHRAKSHFEDMAKEIRPIYKEAFKDVNTASMEKIDKRRLKDGYRKS